MKRSAQPTGFGITEDFLKELYDDCLNNNFEEDDFKEVYKYLHQIVTSYHSTDKLIFKLPHVGGFINIFTTFRNIVLNEQYDNLDNFIDFLLRINFSSLYFGVELKAIVFPQDYYKFHESEAILVFDQIFKSYENSYLSSPYDKPITTRIEEIAECYLRHIREIPRHLRKNELLLVARYIGGYFFLKDEDISKLDEIYEYYYNNFSSIDDYLALNLDKKSSEFNFDKARYLVDNKLPTVKKIIK